MYYLEGLSRILIYQFGQKETIEMISLKIDLEDSQCLPLNVYSLNENWFFSI